MSTRDETHEQALALYRAGITARAAALKAGLPPRTFHKWLKQHNELRSQDAWARFEAKIDRTASCWLWRASVGPFGYGQFRADGTMVRAHRWAYQHIVGPLHPAVHLDHLCGERRCVNPDHLDPVSQAENNRRAVITRSARRALGKAHV